MLDNLLAGSIAGAIGAFGVLPIDTTKTRIQSYKIKIPSYEVIKSIYKLNGIKGFYKGGTTQILFVAPEKAIKFTTNDYVLKHITDNKIVAGMCAGLSQVIVTNPMEILKIQMQMNITNPHYTIVDAIKRTVNEKFSKSKKEVIEFKIRFTEGGLSRYIMEEDSIPMVGIQDPKDENIMTFKTTETSIFHHLFKYGAQAQILWPLDARERFMKLYKVSYEAYLESVY